MRTKEESRAYHAANADKRNAQRNARYAANPEKEKARNAAYRAANPEKARASTKAWRVANPGKSSASARMKKYGVSQDCFQLMLAVQKNACGICKEIFLKSPHVDHCHETGEVRGLLCGQCNKALGGFKDSPEILERAKEYLLG